MRVGKSKKASRIAQALPSKRKTPLDEDKENFKPKEFG